MSTRGRRGWDDDYSDERSPRGRSRETHRRRDKWRPSHDDILPIGDPLSASDEDLVIGDDLLPIDPPPGGRPTMAKVPCPWPGCTDEVDDTVVALSEHIRDIHTVPTSICPYCHSTFKDLARHLPRCKKNPHRIGGTGGGTHAMALTPAEEARLVALENFRTAIEGRVTALETRVTAIETRLGTADITTMATNLAALQANVGPINVGTMATQITGLDGRVTNIETTITTAHLAGHDVGTELTTLRNDVNTAQADITAVEGQATAVRDALNDQTNAAHAGSLAAQIQGHEGRISTLEHPPAPTTSAFRRLFDPGAR